MDSNNVNYNIAVHKDSQNRRRDILKRAWAQTLSAHPRNKKKSGETDSPPGGVGSWGHWEAQGGSCDVSASDPSCWSGVFGSSVSLLLEGFLLGFSREWPWGMPDQGWGGACGQYGPSCTPALAVTSISPHSLPEPAHCSLLKVWTTAGRIPADRRKITRILLLRLPRPLKTDGRGKFLEKHNQSKLVQKHRRVWLVLGADESVIRNFPSKETPDLGAFTSEFYWTLKQK